MHRIHMDTFYRLHRVVTRMSKDVISNFIRINKSLLGAKLSSFIADFFNVLYVYYYKRTHATSLENSDYEIILLFIIVSQYAIFFYTS